MLRPRDEQYHHRVGEQLDDAERGAPAWSLALGDVRDTVHGPETGHDQGSLRVRERARGPEPGQLQRADEPPDAAKRRFDPDGCARAGRVRVRLMRHFLLRLRPADLAFGPFNVGIGYRLSARFL